MVIIVSLAFYFISLVSELKRPFKLPYARILSPISFVGASLIVYWTGWPTVAYISIIIFAGFFIYLLLFALGRVESIFSRDNIKGGYWVPLMRLQQRKLVKESLHRAI